MLSRKLGAWLNLAWHFALHVLVRLPLRPLRRGRDLQRIMVTLSAEGYLPLEPDARAAFPRTMNCVHCGLCTLVGESLHGQPASAWDEAWTFVAGSSRMLDRAPLVAGALPASVSETEPERVCPMGIPIRHMAETMRRLHW